MTNIDKFIKLIDATRLSPVGNWWSYRIEDTVMEFQKGNPYISKAQLEKYADKALVDINAPKNQRNGALYGALLAYMNTPSQILIKLITNCTPEQRECLQAIWANDQSDDVIATLVSVDTSFLARAFLIARNEDVSPDIYPSNINKMLKHFDYNAFYGVPLKYMGRSIKALMDLSEKDIGEDKIKWAINNLYMTDAERDDIFANCNVDPMDIERPTEYMAKTLYESCADVLFDETITDGKALQQAALVLQHGLIEKRCLSDDCQMDLYSRLKDSCPTNFHKNILNSLYEHTSVSTIIKEAPLEFQIKSGKISHGEFNQKAYEITKELRSLGNAVDDATSILGIGLPLWNNLSLLLREGCVPSPDIYDFVYESGCIEQEEDEDSPFRILYHIDHSIECMLAYSGYTPSHIIDKIIDKGGKTPLDFDKLLGAYLNKTLRECDITAEVRDAVLREMRKFKEDKRNWASIRPSKLQRVLYKIRENAPTIHCSVNNSHISSAMMNIARNIEEHLENCTWKMWHPQYSVSSRIINPTIMFSTDIPDAELLSRFPRKERLTFFSDCSVKVLDELKHNIITTFSFCENDYTIALHLRNYAEVVADIDKVIAEKEKDIKKDTKEKDGEIYTEEMI